MQIFSGSRIAIICMFGAGGAGTLCAQESKLIPPQRLLKDFEDAIEIIEAHPAPYRAISEAALQSQIDSTRRLLNAPMDVLDFYKLLSPIYAALRDGHSSVYVSREWMISHYKRSGVFPFSIFLSQGNRLFLVEQHASDSTITPGAEVFEINGISVDSFLAHVSQYISFETETFRNSIITEQFDLYLLLAFGVRDTVTLAYQPYQSEERLVHSIRLMSYEGWKKARDDEEIRIQHLIEEGEPYEYSLVTSGVGMLKIHSFAIFNRSRFDLFLDKVFRMIAKDEVHSLLVDVRGNTGGAMYSVADLLHRLTTKRFQVTAISEMKVSNSYREYFQDMAPAASFYRMLPISAKHSFSPAELFRKDVGEFIVERETFKEVPQNIYHRFSGDIYLLIDGRSFSASTSLAAAFRCYQLGLIVGSPTGGTRIFHANNMYKELPASKLICTMATTRIYTPCFSNEDENIVPDIEVQPSIFHLMSGRDAVIDYVVHLTRKVQKMKGE